MTNDVLSIVTEVDRWHYYNVTDLFCLSVVAASQVSEVTLVGHAVQWQIPDIVNMGYHRTSNNNHITVIRLAMSVEVQTIQPVCG